MSESQIMIDSEMRRHAESVIARISQRIRDNARPCVATARPKTRKRLAGSAAAARPGPGGAAPGRAPG